MVQREFSFGRFAAGSLLALAILLFKAALYRLPNRAELGPRAVALRFEPIALGSIRDPLRVAGSWRLHAEDERFGGISALAVDGPDLIALSDSGVVARFPKPGRMTGQLRLGELPGGPGHPGFKSNRDSEALVADPGGRGWWVAFENRDEIWLFDRSFSRALRRFSAPADHFAYNRGIEGIAVDNGKLLLFPERGARVVSSDGSARPISGLGGWVSDAVRLPDGQLVVAIRSPTPIGLRNAIGFLEPDGKGYRVGRRWRVPVGRLDNVEALVAEPLPGGRTRIWAMTDNNLQQRRPTLLIALELRRPPGPR